MNKKKMNEIRDEIDRWDQLMESPDWDENTTAMWAMAEEIVRLRNELAEQAIIHEVQKTNTVSEIERLRLILTHICDVWGSDLLSIIDEMNRFKKEIK
jgi:hypothetical protein